MPSNRCAGGEEGECQLKSSHRWEECQKFPLCSPGFPSPAYCQLFEAPVFRSLKPLKVFLNPGPPLNKLLISWGGSLACSMIFDQILPPRCDVHSFQLSISLPPPIAWNPPPPTLPSQPPKPPELPICLTTPLQ